MNKLFTQAYKLTTLVILHAFEASVLSSVSGASTFSGHATGEATRTFRGDNLLQVDDVLVLELLQNLNFSNSRNGKLRQRTKCAAQSKLLRSVL